MQTWIAKNTWKLLHYCFTLSQFFCLYFRNGNNYLGWSHSNTHSTQVSLPLCMKGMRMVEKKNGKRLFLTTTIKPGWWLIPPLQSYFYCAFSDSHNFTDLNECESNPQWFWWGHQLQPLSSSHLHHQSRKECGVWSLAYLFSYMIKFNIYDDKSSQLFQTTFQKPPIPFPSIDMRHRIKTSTQLFLNWYSRLPFTYIAGQIFLRKLWKKLRVPRSPDACQSTIKDKDIQRGLWWLLPWWHDPDQGNFL